jgi:predicted MPP superfamily phosphohydrolase
MRRLIPAAFFILFSYFIYSYTFQGIQTVTASLSSFYQNLIQWGYWSFFAGIVVFVLSGMLTREFGRTFKMAIHAYIIVLVSQLVFDMILLGEDLFRVAYASLSTFTDSSTVHLSRNPVISKVGIFLATIPLVSFVYGMVKGKYKYTVHRHTLHFEDLPQEFDGFTITQISDVHAGSFDDADAVQRGIDMINEQKSDLFVFTGDLVNNEAKEIKPWINHFRQIEARDGKFSILGNHDYGDYVRWNSIAEKVNNLDMLKQHHSEIGFRLLLDEHVSLTRNGKTIKLLGVENWGEGFGKRGNLTKALNGSRPDEFKILLSHDPSHWNAEVKNHESTIHLTLSGHTHGMQFGIEKFGIKWSPVKYRYRHWAGLLHENNRYLYINRGFGFLGFSGRVGIWPEITVLELRRKN